MSRASLALLVATLLAAGRAHAGDAETCARSYEAAQTRRQESKPLAARKELLVCAQDSCPAFVRRDCTQWLNEVESEVPSIAVRVHGPDGCDRADATVALDGAALPGAADGRTIELEPGSHAIRATVGKATTEQNVVVAPGDTVCGAPAAPPPVVVTPIGPTPPPADTAPAKKKVPTLTWVLGGSGLVVGAVSLGFGITAWNEKGTLDDCKGHCAEHDVSTMKRNFIIADVTMFTSIAALGAAAIYYLVKR